MTRCRAAIGAGIEGGLAVVLMAIYLDRVTAAFGGQGRGNPAWWPQRRSRAGVELAQSDQPALPSTA